MLMRTTRLGKRSRLTSHILYRVCVLYVQGDKLESDEQGFVTWDSGDFHYFGDVAQDGPLTCQYVFVMDALNFCFWPTEK